MAEKEQNLERSKATSSARDLGTAGGGSVPDAGPVPENRPSEVVEQAAEEASSPQNKNANSVDAIGQSNLGGRNPGQAQNAMGDQDRTHSRPGDDPTDPMTSRAPDKVNQQKEQEK